MIPKNMGDSFLFHTTFPEFSASVDGACVFVCFTTMTIFPEVLKEEEDFLKDVSRTNMQQRCKLHINSPKVNVFLSIKVPAAILLRKNSFDKNYDHQTRAC